MNKEFRRNNRGDQAKNEHVDVPPIVGSETSVRQMSVFEIPKVLENENFKKSKSWELRERGPQRHHREYSERRATRSTVGHQSLTSGLSRFNRSPNYLKIVTILKNLGTKPFDGGMGTFKADLWFRNWKKKILDYKLLRRLQERCCCILSSG
ncbi:unnamed protein product [Arabidopsis halleri]